ncbi:MAG: cytochrome P450 [Chloroflexota bacterium]|nr:cytochrome P450 [Chloroflexota bacterium]MDQ5865494.1 cytochrome P450 [Chloroflexota bacterium]
MSITSTIDSRSVPLTEIPGPRAIPLLGWRSNMLALLRDPINYMLWLHHTYGDVVALPRRNPRFVFVFSPEYNRQVLSDQMLFYNGEVNSPGSPVKLPPGSSAVRLFSGITTRNGAKHIQQRRLLMPAFHKKRIEALRDVMLERTERHIERWQPGGQVDLLSEMKSLTLAVAVQAILGLDPQREGDRVRRVMERWFKLVLSYGVVAFPYDLPGTPFRRMLRFAERIDDEIRAMIRRRRALGDGAAGLDALSMLLQAHDEDGTRLTDDELVGHTTALFVAGHETTASALTWTLFLLAQHPRVLRDLLDELHGKLRGSAPTVEQLNGLPLLDAVIKESLRLFPPGLWFLRVNTAPTSFGPYDIPKGTSILWSPAVVRRRPDLYPEPNAFKPERWSSIDPSPYEYMPFGAGPRRCLGATFAIMEMKMVLPVILQRFGIRLRQGLQVDLGGSPLATPRGGLPVRLTSPGRIPAPAKVRGNIRRLVDLP